MVLRTFLFSSKVDLCTQFAKGAGRKLCRKKNCISIMKEEAEIQRKAMTANKERQSFQKAVQKYNLLYVSCFLSLTHFTRFGGTLSLIPSCMALPNSCFFHTKLLCTMKGVINTNVCWACLPCLFVN